MIDADGFGRWIIGEEPISAAPELGRVPIAFEVRSVFDVAARGGGLGG